MQITLYVGSHKVEVVIRYSFRVSFLCADLRPVFSQLVLYLTRRALLPNATRLPRFAALMFVIYPVSRIFDIDRLRSSGISRRSNLVPQAASLVLDHRIMARPPGFRARMPLVR